MNKDRTNILIIRDTRRLFWKKYIDQKTTVSLDTDEMVRLLEVEGFKVDIADCSALDLSQDFSRYYVLFSSLEDFNGGSKAYIEDVLLALSLNGAILLPDFQYFRAHDNKVMMELIRTQLTNPLLKSIQSSFYSSYRAVTQYNGPWPVVIKASAGAGSTGVYLANHKRELKKYTQIISRLPGKLFALSFKTINFMRAIRRLGPINFNNQKFILQNYIPNLNGDYKVLVFGNHFFVLHRLNRPNDFRASGSGQFVPVDLQHLIGVLDFAEVCREGIQVPFLSLDIGFDGHNYHLIEFQCVSFGLKALTLADAYYVLESDKRWTAVRTKTTPEVELVYALLQFINRGKPV